MADITVMTEEQAAELSPTTPAVLFMGCLIAVETLILAVSLSFVGLPVLLVGAVAEFFLWGASATRSRTTVIAVGVLAAGSIPLLALALVIHSLSDTGM